uniref:Tachykinin-like peptides receptor 86C n=2 Tax=Hirondellea gigas TaxID=1518452 RepID=A0A6A7FZZ2_9CRUS
MIDTAEGGMEGGGHEGHTIYNKDSNHNQDYASNSMSNLSLYPTWVTEYMECAVKVSQSLNMSVAENVWVAILHNEGNATNIVVTSRRAHQSNSGSLPSDVAQGDDHLFHQPNYGSLNSSSQSTNSDAFPTPSIHPKPTATFLDYSTLFLQHLAAFNNIDSENEFYSTSTTSYHDTTIPTTTSGDHPNDNNIINTIMKNSSSVNDGNITQFGDSQRQLSATSDYYYLGSGGSSYMSSNDTENALQVIHYIANWCLKEVATEEQRPYLLPWWQQVLWTLAFGFMLSVAIGGNSLVMWIVCAHRRMRTVTNYFLMNLSVADLLMSVLNCMFNFIFMLHSDWPFGDVYCTISNCMANITIAASVFTLMAISFDRYIAIVRPLEPRMSKTMARVFIAVIWIASFLLAIPCMIFSTTVTIRYKDDKIRRGCILQWPDGSTSASIQEHIYNIVFFITTYMLPMLMMLSSYLLISRELWGSTHIGELTERQINIIRSKRRVVRMFIVIVVIFAICWLPQQAFFLYQYHNSDVLDTDHVQHIYLAFYWLAMANAMVNPIIYYWMNARFRSYFREVIMQCLCLRLYQKHHRNYTASPVLERRGHAPSGHDEHSSRSRSGNHHPIPLHVNAWRT